MQSRCAAPGCSSGKSDPQPLFRFPRDAERCKTWVEKCLRNDLADKPPDQLNRYYRLCGKHFDPSLIDTDAPSKVLKDDAIPTIFEGISQSQLGQSLRKRAGVPEKSVDDETEARGRKKVKKSEVDAPQEDVQTLSEEEANREYVKSLFEVLLMLGEQSIPPTGPSLTGQGDLGSSNIQILLEYRMNCGDDVLKKRYEEKGETKECCSSSELSQLIQVSETFIRDKLVEEVKQSGSFSLITDDLVRISAEWYLPTFVRFVDQSNCQRERFFGFLSFAGDGEDLAEKLLSEITNTWGLDMEQCRAQAHSYSGAHFSQIKSFSAKMLEKYPKAIPTPRSSRTLNMSLADGMALSGVQLVMATLSKIESFFSQSHLLQEEFEHAISIFYADKEERANELKELSRTAWTRQGEAFEVALDLLEALLLCVDSVHDNEDMKWSDRVTHDALEISKALADFEFVISLVVLKNTMTLTQAFGKNVQGKESDVHFATTNLKGVLHSLKEVSDNIDVYHEFWNDEAVNLAAAMEIPVSLPRAHLRKCALESRTVLTDGYYKDHLSVPVVNHIMNEVNALFSDEHMKFLKCLSLIPEIIEQQKSNEPEEENVQAFRDYIPNAASLSAELHCWWVKWSKKGKGETFPSTLRETLQLADVKFFPNMLAVLRLIGTMPTFALEDSEAYKRFKTYMKNTPDHFRSKGLSLLNINYDAGYDLDSMVEVYINKYPATGEVAS